MTIQSIKMLNGALGTITSATINQRGVSLINTGWGRKWDPTHTHHCRRGFCPWSKTQSSLIWDPTCLAEHGDGTVSERVGRCVSCVYALSCVHFFVRTYMDQSLPFFYVHFIFSARTHAQDIYLPVTWPAADTDVSVSLQPHLYSTLQVITTQSPGVWARWR